jgi:hypothetical protein
MVQARDGTRIPMDAYLEQIRDVVQVLQAWQALAKATGMPDWFASDAACLHLQLCKMPCEHALSKESKGKSHLREQWCPGLLKSAEHLVADPAMPSCERDYYRAVLLAVMHRDKKAAEEALTMAMGAHAATCDALSKVPSSAPPSAEGAAAKAASMKSARELNLCFLALGPHVRLLALAALILKTPKACEKVLKAALGCAPHPHTLYTVSRILAHFGMPKELRQATEAATPAVKSVVQLELAVRAMQIDLDESLL